MANDKGVAGRGLLHRGSAIPESVGGADARETPNEPSRSTLARGGVSRIYSTAAWWAPLMTRLIKPDGEMLLRDYQLLMSTHWIRLALITAYGVTSFYTLIRSMVGTQWSAS